MTPFAREMGLIKDEPSAHKATVIGFPSKGINFQNMIRVRVDGELKSDEYHYAFWERQ